MIWFRFKGCFSVRRARAPLSVDQTRSVARQCQANARPDGQARTALICHSPRAETWRCDIGNLPFVTDCRNRRADEGRGHPEDCSPGDGSSARRSHGGSAEGVQPAADGTSRRGPARRANGMTPRQPVRCDLRALRWRAGRPVPAPEALAIAAFENLIGPGRPDPDMTLESILDRAGERP